MTASHRVRGIVGMAAIWGVTLSAAASAFFIGGLALHAIPASVFGPTQVLAIALRALVMGALAGATFAILLAKAERQRTLATLSMRRVAVWGGIGMAGIPLLAALVLGLTPAVPPGVLLGSGIMLAGLGAALGTGTVRVAQRGNTLGALRPLRELPHGS